MTTPLCILLADDSPFFLTLERQFLRHTPATVLEAKNSGEALSLARAYRPSLVFMNIGLQPLDGISCCRQFGSDQELKTTPVILIGECGKEEQRMAAAEAGCAAFLTKPLDRRAFLDAGHKLLVGIDRREPRRECNVTVAFNWQHAEHFGQCIDISSGGMFLKVDPKATKGDLLPLRFRLPDEQRTSIELIGRVAWVNTHAGAIKPNLPAGYGLEFVDIPEKAAIELRRCFLN